MADYDEKIKEMEEEEESMEDEVLELVGDDGEVEHFYHLATLEYKNQWYVVLQPTEETEGVSEDELIIFMLSTDEKSGEDVFMSVDDEDTLNAVYDEYLKLVDSDECDCEECGDDCDSDDDHCDCHDHEHTCDCHKE